MRKKVWTTGRKAIGNLLPALVFLPPVAAGIWLMMRDGVILGPGMWLVGLAPVAAWIALNFFGYYGNRTMRRELSARLKADRPDQAAPSFFVGFAAPSYHGLLDAHQDVGHLLLHDDRLEFVGEDQRVTLQRAQIGTVRFRPNVHTLLGLGRWIAVEGRVDGKPVRLLVEPRERDTMLANLLFGSELKAKIEGWLRKQA